MGLATVAGPPSAQERPRDGFGPGARVLLDAHNAYPYQGRWADRIDRALATGLPLAIEQDLVWRPATGSRPAHSIVSHGEPFTGEEPSLRDHFFERVRPIIERALASGDRRDWPLLVLNLDFKTNEPEHHEAIWHLLGDYEPWLTTALRTATPAVPEPLDVRPVLVLTGDHDQQQVSFHDRVPVGGRLRVFGAVALRAAEWAAANGLGQAPRDVQWAAFWEALPRVTLPRATNYRRWWNNPWAVVEQGGQRRAGPWTRDDADRLARLVSMAHEAGLWVRFYTLNGHREADAERLGFSPGYNFGSLEAARERWRAAIDARVDFVAVDQYELFAEELRRRTTPAAGAPVR